MSGGLQIFIHHVRARGPSRISPDGSGYRSKSGTVVDVTWVGRPRFFESGNVIALYLVGQQQPPVNAATDRKVMRALTASMGKPFAGTP